MTNSERTDIKILEQYFKNSKNADWVVTPLKHPTSETGWDLKAERPNQVLLIEAKHFGKGSHSSKFAGLLASPLLNRPEKSKSGKYRTWSTALCWAIGIDKKSFYQWLFDCLKRNFKFYRLYVTELKVKYIYFVEDKKVAKISFEKLLKLLQNYNPPNNAKLKEKRNKAEEIVQKYLKFKPVI